MNKRRFLSLLACLPLIGVAQTQEVDMADKFREDGKIYVVISVIGIIFVCIAAFLFYLERRVSKLEKNSDPSETDSQARH